MTALSEKVEVSHVLFYLPPCGKWYVHSHKIYPSKEEARVAAQQFLQPGTFFATLPFNDFLLSPEQVPVS